MDDRYKRYDAATNYEESENTQIIETNKSENKHSIGSGKTQDWTGRTVRGGHCSEKTTFDEHQRTVEDSMIGSLRFSSRLVLRQSTAVFSTTINESFGQSVVSQTPT